jgi:predicted nucleotidyltransferase
MAESLMDILIEEAQEKEKYFKNYLFYAKEIKKVAEKLLGKARVFVFGSILRKKRLPEILIFSLFLQNSKPRLKKAKFWQNFGKNLVSTIPLSFI